MKKAYDAVWPRLFLAQASYFDEISMYRSLVKMGLLISSNRVGSIFP